MSLTEFHKTGHSLLIITIDCSSPFTSWHNYFHKGEPNIWHSTRFLSMCHKHRQKVIEMMLKESLKKICDLQGYDQSQYMVNRAKFSYFVLIFQLIICQNSAVTVFACFIRLNFEHQKPVLSKCLFLRHRFT